MPPRRTMLTGAATAAFVPAIPAIVRAKDTPGVSATEIRIGNTMPYSGPASAYGTIGKADAATFRMANDRAVSPGAGSTSSPTTIIIARPKRSRRCAG